MDKLVLVSGNKDKYNEFREFLPSLKRVDIDLPEIQSNDAREIIRYKIEKAKEKVGGGSIIVEDTSLYLDCLNGLPGPLIKWFEEKIGNEGIHWLTRGLNNNKAKAKTIIGLYDGEFNFFEGVVKGEVVSPRGDRDFGWDPIFKPGGREKTFAEMTNEEKNKISMRRKALDKLNNYLTDD